MSKFLETTLAATTAALVLAAPASAEKFNLGREAIPEEVAAWDIDVRPDGLGLPEGRGTVAEGEEIFAEKCAMCHGEFGEGVDRWPVLAGGQGSLKDERPVKTIGSYWPYLSTAWDYPHRAMPFGFARSLTADETYAIDAYLLYVNDLVDEDFELNRENFTSIHLPNENGFYMDDRDQVEVPKFTREPCMENCKESVEITARAAVLDVTPEETAARKAEEAAKAAAQDEEAKAEEGTAAGASETVAAEEAAPAPAAEAALDPELVKRGEKVFKKCKACHAVGEGAKNKTGPILTGVVGRPAASVEGFKYSRALRAKGEEGLVWDEAALIEFLKKPKAFVPKTKMSFAGLKKEKDREAIIAYLKSVGQ